MIYTFIPYATNLRLGTVINDFVSRLDDDAWVLLLDHDTLFLTQDWYRLCYNAIQVYPDTDLFTCQTNRVGSPHRCYNNQISTDPNILNHMKIARTLEHQIGHECIEVQDRTVPGYFMLFSKQTWEQNPFDDLKIIDEVAPHKIESFDVRWVKQLKGSIKKIMGLYIWHTYRLDRDLRDTNHLQFE